jgi:hypothetical protein
MLFNLRNHSAIFAIGINILLNDKDIFQIASYCAKIEQSDKKTLKVNS